jgi:hypothetical protein
MDPHCTELRHLVGFQRHPSCAGGPGHTCELPRKSKQIQQDQNRSNEYEFTNATLTTLGFRKDMEGSCYNQIALPYTHAFLVAKSSWQLADYRLMLEVHDFEPSRMKELKPHQGKVPAPGTTH